MTVVDLRAPEEIDGGVHPLGRATVFNLPPAMPPRPARSRALEASFVARRYHAMLHDGQDTVREVLALLTDPSLYPAVIHCCGGHDRTGVVSAVVLGLLGASDDDIVADYVLSRDAMLRRLAWAATNHEGARRDVAEHGFAVLGVMPEAMIGFLARLRGEYGSFAGYAESIDMTGSLRHLRAALLLPSSDVSSPAPPA